MTLSHNENYKKKGLVWRLYASKWYGLKNAHGPRNAYGPTKSKSVNDRNYSVASKFVFFKKVVKVNIVTANLLSWLTVWCRTTSVSKLLQKHTKKVRKVIFIVLVFCCSHQPQVSKGDSTRPVHPIMSLTPYQNR